MTRIQRSYERWKTVNSYIEAAPAFTRPYLRRVYAVYAKWNRQKIIGAMPMIDGERAAWGIVAVCSVVWVLWRRGASASRPVLRQWMDTHFCHRPVSGKSYTILTSVFSHQDFWHIGCNSLSLLSFGELSDDYAYAPIRDCVSVYLMNAY